MVRKYFLILLAILLLGFAIRIYKINNISLFGDELDFGYQALSIVQTGKDYYGNTFPVYFHSISEWKTSVFVYTLSPFIALFGISDLGIRLPSIIFGTFSLLFIYLLVKELTNNTLVAIMSAFFLAITPWHIHYSRIGFEASEMFLAYIAGVYFFYKGLTKNKLLFLSAFSFAVSLVVYRTQIVFVPATVTLLIWIFRKQLVAIPKKYLTFPAIIFLIICVPVVSQSLFGNGLQRISSVSIFDSQKMNYDVGILRAEDEKYQSKGFFTSFSSKVLHNKYTYYAHGIFNNFFKSFSTEFLFVSGDTNPRQNVPGMGELYKYQLPFLLIGLLLFVDKKINRKSKVLLLGWLFFSPLASSLTRDGANHATRLYMMLLPLSILFSYGVYFIYSKFETKMAKRFFWVIFTGCSFIFLLSFLHTYFIHYPSASEKWWHSGFKEAISAVISEKNNYDKIIISGADEPSEIFFLAYSAYPPKDFQKTFFSDKFDLKGFGKVSVLDNFLFTEVGVGKDLYSLPKDLPEGYLYLATAKEIALDLVAEPERVPDNLRLLKTITYPSGRPVYYLFSKN